MKILVIEDERDSRKLISSVLEAGGIQVVATESAAKARLAISESKFNAILCDVAMADEDGLSFIRRLRASESPDCQKIPAAALSGFASKDDKDQAIAAGFDMHLSKPIYPKELLKAVQKLLGIRKESAIRFSSGMSQVD